MYYNFFNWNLLFVIAIKKSCSDTRDKCVFMEKSRNIAMDVENLPKLTTESMDNFIYIYFRMFIMGDVYWWRLVFGIINLLQAYDV